MSEAEHISNARLYKRKGRGHTPKISILRTRNAVPKGQSFTWATTEMKESHAWRAMPLAARQVVDRIEIEHGAHGGELNGKLPVTYRNFEEYGIRCRSIPYGIRAAVALGWIDITEPGLRGEIVARRAARYALTWVDRHDGAPRSNRWKHIKTMDEAVEAVDKVRPKKKTEAAGGVRPAKKRKAGLKAA
jgi:hypothetical protein